MLKNLPAVQEMRVRSLGWQEPTPVFLPGESCGQRSLVGYSPWDRREWDTTEATELACTLCHSFPFPEYLGPWISEAWELGKTERAFWEWVIRLEYVAVDNSSDCSDETDGRIWICELI